MIRHVILWQLKDDIQDKAAVKAGIKDGLEGLAGKIPGMADIRVYLRGLDSSNADAMLDAVFVDEAALKGYAQHPTHVAVAEKLIRPYYKNRVCLDFEVDCE